MRRRGAKSFVDDLVLSRGVVLSRADLFCDLLRLSPMTRRFVSFRLTYLRRRLVFPSVLAFICEQSKTTWAYWPASQHAQVLDRRVRLESLQIRAVCE